MQFIDLAAQYQHLKTRIDTRIQTVLDHGQYIMGREVTELEEKTSFIYKAPFENGLTEHEFDHIMVGYYNDEPNINKDEVEAWKWMSLDEVKVDIELHPELYTAWFKIIFEKFYEFIKH